MKTALLRDSLFSKLDEHDYEDGVYCLHANGDNVLRRPANVQWAPTGDLAHHLHSSGPRWVERAFGGKWVWLTESHLHEAHQWREVGAKVCAWLLEPEPLHPENYVYVLNHLAQFDAVVSHDRAYLDYIATFDPGLVGNPVRGLFAPSGGTRIHPSDWGIPEKSRAVSIVASPKRSMEGHRLRHELIRVMAEEAGRGWQTIEGGLHTYGPNYIPVDRKRDALLPYRFSVAIENCRRDYWFTEALIDCFLTGTVPIYWGCPSIGEFFNPDGMIECESLEELREWVENVVQAPNGYYNARADAIRDNFIRAHEYTLTEDWLFRQYPELFE